MSSLTQEQIHEYYEAFCMYDHDGSGTIDTFGAGHHHDPRWARTSLSMSSNGLVHERSGTIDFPEFVSLMVNHVNKPVTKEEIKSAFMVFDLEKRGYITSDELRFTRLELWVAEGSLKDQGGCSGGPLKDQGGVQQCPLKDQGGCSGGGPLKGCKEARMTRQFRQSSLPEIVAEVLLESVDALSADRLISRSLWSKCRPYIFGASPGGAAILMHSSAPRRASSTCLPICSVKDFIKHEFSIKGAKPLCYEYLELLSNSNQSRRAYKRLDPAEVHGLLARHRDRRAHLENAGLNNDGRTHDWVPAVEDELRQDAQLAGEHGDVFELLPFRFDSIVSPFDERVAQVVDDVGSENLHARDCPPQLLRLALHLHVEGQNDRPTWRGIRVNDWFHLH
uniref:EF-hand domain-containing protein n=1 Tax=Macrostomum lignano TaxID=282301 RepID=A0A1I8FPF7_9PLAT